MPNKKAKQRKWDKRKRKENIKKWKREQKRKRRELVGLEKEKERN